MMSFPAAMFFMLEKWNPKRIPCLRRPPAPARHLPRLVVPPFARESAGRSLRGTEALGTKRHEIRAVHLGQPGFATGGVHPTDGGLAIDGMGERPKRPCASASESAKHPWLLGC